MTDQKLPSLRRDDSQVAMERCWLMLDEEGLLQVSMVPPTRVLPSVLRTVVRVERGRSTRIPPMRMDLPNASEPVSARTRTTNALPMADNVMLGWQPLACPRMRTTTTRSRKAQTRIVGFTACSSGSRHLQGEKGSCTGRIALVCTQML